MIPIDSTEIAGLRQDRFVLEQSLALGLLDVFNSEKYGLIGPLRKMALNALDFMLKEPDKVAEFPFRVSVLTGAHEERFLAVWKQLVGENGKTTLKKIKAVRARCDALTASQCSDVIRLYGAVVEEWGKRTGTRGAQQDTLKRQYRPDYSQGGLIWDDKHRVRTKRPKGYKAPGLQKAFTSPTPVSGIDLKYATSMDVAYKVGSKSVHGIAMSTVLKIDKAFGLPVGADISGTTADSLFFIERFTRRCGMKYDPIFQLLALATLVSHRHHALLEVALTMTLNRRVTSIDYTIGFYKTLLPQAPTDSLYHDAYAEVRNVLDTYEVKVKPRNILVYFDPKGRTIGGYKFESDELDRFKRLSTTGKSFMWRWATMPGFPTRIRIHSLMNSYGLNPPG